MVRRILLIAFSVLLSFQVSSADISDEKKELIDTLLEQTGQSGLAVGRQFSDHFIQQITLALERSNPSVNPRIYGIVREEVTNLINEELVLNSGLSEMMYPIYDRYFSVEELKKLIALNNTEFGKKMIRVMPQVTREGMQAGQAFGQRLGPLLRQRLEARLEQEGLR